MSKEKDFLEVQMLYQKQIADLETKLSESEKTIENLRIDLKDWQDLEEKISTKYDRVVEQLAEKDKEIERLNKTVKKLNLEAQKYYEDAYCNNFHNQDKINFAVDKLETVKKLLEEEYVYEVNECDYAIVYEDNIEKIINNQIKQLKEME